MVCFSALIPLPIPMHVSMGFLLSNNDLIEAIARDVNIICGLFEPDTMIMAAHVQTVAAQIAYRRATSLC